MLDKNDLINSVSELKRQSLDLFKALRKLDTEVTPEIDGAVESIRDSLRELTSIAQAEVSNSKLLQDLVQSSALINSSLELDQVLENLLDSITKITGAERSYLLMRDESDGEFKPRIARNWEQENLTESEVNFSLSVINKAVQEGVPILTDNAQSDNRFGSSESVVMMNLRSIICIPLRLHGETIGVLYADNRFASGVFRESIVPLLSAFATQAGIALQNAQQFERVRDDLAEANREVRQLKILLNRGKIDEEVGSITESEYFQNLQKAIDEIRAEFNQDL